jgi:hypothetical protein
VVTDLDRREDTVFQLFSLSQMLQFRGGLRYSFTPATSWYGDYSYQRYEKLAGIYVNGNVGSSGFLWLPGGDGLEAVRLEYYVYDSDTSIVNGVNAYYENRVYDRIIFRALLDVAYYEKVTNNEGTALTGFAGIGYVLRPGLVAEVNLEGNTNKYFSEDIRFGFFVVYNFDYRGWPPRPMTQSADAATPRPRPWGLASFGPASWGPTL